MKINTYAVNCNDAWLNTEGDDISGSYVKYKDHLDVVDELEAKCAALAAKGMELAAEAAVVYGKYNETQMPDRDLVDMQTIQEMHDLCAAMLQGAEPVSQPDELPLDYLQGHKDGLEWAARLAEANHPQTGDWLYDDPLELAKAIRKGPDMPTASVQGWIPCGERMPDEIGRYWCYVEEQNSLGKSHYQWNCSWNGDRWWVESENGGRVTHWMPLQAAPQQEVKSGR